ncbi:MAG: iron-containing alcohol dehydrogenase [Spirochaetales bacterium]|nr:iron-containing alcohol dehydrogenase [Spirochaetales bacterium]
MENFKISAIPELNFGIGTINGLTKIITARGFTHIVVITGGNSFVSSSYWANLKQEIFESNIKYVHFQSVGETNPETVDGIISNLKNKKTDAIVAIGGGTVLDTAKAVSAMLCMDGSVVDYLEGVGTKEPTGKRKPLICVPTTSGTGSEATKNAVITKIGKDGYKKSLRHEGYIPDTVIIDPELTKSCPLSLTVASGMDTVTQLLESYVSIKATPFTDPLALYGLKLAGRSLPRLIENGDDMEARADMAYASYLSGITLANAGLGVVHGAASVLGAMRSIPHGVVCGTLLGSATEVIINKIRNSKDSVNTKSLTKFSEAGAALTGNNNMNTKESCNNLIKTLNTWVDNYGISRLSDYGFTEKDILDSINMIGLKNTPCTLNFKEILSILMVRL